MAKEAGYDGVEVMGSEGCFQFSLSLSLLSLSPFLFFFLFFFSHQKRKGYLISQFVCQRTNLRTDEWGGSFENRIRFPIEIVRRIRELTGPDFVIIFRLSLLDLVEQGNTWEEVSEWKFFVLFLSVLGLQVEKLCVAVQDVGANIINSGIGWHESRVPYEKNSLLCCVFFLKKKIFPL